MFQETRNYIHRKKKKCFMRIHIMFFLGNIAPYLLSVDLKNVNIAFQMQEINSLSF